MKREELNGLGSRELFSGGVVPLKRALLVFTGHRLQRRVPSLEYKMELPQLERVRLRRCDSAGETNKACQRNHAAKVLLTQR